MGKAGRAAAVVAIAMAWAMPASAGVAEGNAAWLAGNYAKAIAEWRPAADGGSPEAQFNLGQAYKLGNGVTANPQEAEAWYRKSAAQGFADAEDALGLMLFRAGRRQDAMPYIARSAARGEARSMYVLGTAKFNGDFAEKDWPGAYALMTRAAAAGVQPARASLEQMDRFLSPEDKAAANQQLASSPTAAPAPGTLPPIQPSYTPGVAPAGAPPVQVASAGALPTYTSPPPAAAPAAATQDAGPTAEVDGQVVAVPGAEVNVPMGETPPVRPAPTTITRTPLPASAATAQPPRAAPPVATPAPVQPPRATAPAAVPASAPVRGTPSTTAATPPRPVVPDPVTPPQRGATVPAAAPAPRPQTAAAPAPRPAPVANGRWKVQLGAFGTPAAAQKAWADLSGRVPALRSWRFASERAGAVTRLQAAGLPSKAEAERLCRAVAPTGNGCFPVAP